MINDDNNYRYIYDRTKSQSRDKREIGISAIRGGTIPGTHTIMFAGEDELIEINIPLFQENIRHRSPESSEIYRQANIRNVWNA